MVTVMSTMNAYNAKEEESTNYFISKVSHISTKDYIQKERKYDDE
jgi:hypothetical protein